MAGKERDTVEYTYDDLLNDRFFAPKSPSLRLDCWGASDMGRVRKNNEDHFAIFRRLRSQEVIQTNLPAAELERQHDEAYVLVVADGVGGAEFGEFASRLAIKAFWELAGRATSWMMKLGDYEEPEWKQRIDAYARLLSERFNEQAASNPSLAKMGTTWTSAYVMGRDAIISHVGDSRAYLWQGGQVHRLTKDHTLAEAFIGAGMPETEARQFDNVLTNCFRAGTAMAEAEVSYAFLQPGDVLVLCTDGLTKHVTDDELKGYLKSGGSAQQICEQLVSTALQAGGTDNVTVVVARPMP